MIRFWCIGGFMPAPSYSAASGSAAFDDATLSSHVFLSDGATHVRLDEIDDLYQRFVAATRDDPTVPQRLAKHYVALGETWVDHCAEWFADPSALRALDDDALAARLGQFCDLYSAYAPALYLPFAIERLYAEQFPALLTRIAKGLGDAVTAGLSAAPELETYAGMGIVTVSDALAIERLIRPTLEHTSERTHAERKDAALNRLAGDLISEFGSDGMPSSPEVLNAASPVLAAQLDAVAAEFAWIAQWGFPPRYSASTGLDLLNEALVRAERRPIRAHDGLPAKSAAVAETILDAAGSSPDDRQLLGDFAYYNFYRTYRMELLIRAQYLSVPLLDEIGRRIGLHSREWTSLTPPEMEGALTSVGERSSLSARIEQREAGWFLRADGLRGIRTMVDGSQYRRRIAAFRAVLLAGENARADMDATDSSVVGGKAAALAKLVGGRFRVPDYAVLTTYGVSLLDDDSVGADVRASLREATKAITGTGRFAVRSSASVEDGAAHSWAGRFTSVLNVSFDDVQVALSEVVASATSDRVAAYAQRVGSASSDVAMAVIVQRQIDADFAGVINTSIPAPDGTAAEIEIVPGLGDKLVDGSSTPARYLVRPDGGTTRSGPDFDIPGGLIRELTDLAGQIEVFFSGPQDVEFAVYDGEVFVLQSRPLTGPGAQPQMGEHQSDTDDEPDLVEVVSGLGGHVSARVGGTVAKPAKPSDGGRLKPGTIVVLRAATPIWDSVIYQAAALVTDEGGSTSHAIRVANELSIPAVVGARVATTALRAGDSVVVDTTRGTSNARVLRRVSA